MQQCPLRLLRKSFGKRGQDSWPGLDKDNTRCSRIDMAEIRGYNFVRQFCDGASHLDTRWSSADQHECQQGSDLFWIGLHFSSFKCQQYIAPELRRVHY